jgi:hypothetical protein
MNLALNLIRDRHVKSVADAELPQLASGRPTRAGVIQELMNVNSFYDVMGAYQAGCRLGIDNYLVALHKRICEGIVATTYRIDGKNTI